MRDIVGSVRVADLPKAGDLLSHDVETHDIPDLSWGVNLPEDMADSLAVNMRAIRRIHRVGAFAGGIVLEYQGERTEYSHSVVSVEPDGSATAGKSVVLHKADLAKPSIHYRSDISTDRRTYGKAAVTHDLNKAEMASLVSDGIRTGQTRPEAWADVLNASLKQSYVRAARQHLFLPSNRLAGTIAIVGAIETGPAVMMVSGMIQHDPNLIEVGASLAAISQIVPGVVARTMNADVADRRWSLIPFATQPDRFALTAGIVATSRLVKAIKP